MLLVAISLAIMIVYAGVKLLIQINKEGLGMIYRCAAWAFIIAGFITLTITCIICIALCCRYGMHMMQMNHKMMGHDNGQYMGRYMRGQNTDYYYMKDYHKSMKKMMKCHHKEKDCEKNKDCSHKMKSGGDMDMCSMHAAMCKSDTMKHKH